MLKPSNFYKDVLIRKRRELKGIAIEEGYFVTLTPVALITNLINAKLINKHYRILFVSTSKLKLLLKLIYIVVDIILI